MKLFFTIFGLTFLAELPDKTALAALMLAARRSHLAVFLGACAAFFIQSVVAVSFGQVFSLLPHSVVRYGAAAVFLLLAMKMGLVDEDEEEAPALAEGEAGSRFWADARASFVVIFLAEWGDLTQISTATFAAKYHAPLTIFCAATLALWCVTGLATMAGSRLKHVLSPRVLRRAGAVAFAIVGAALLSGVFG